MISGALQFALGVVPKNRFVLVSVLGQSLVRWMWMLGVWTGLIWCGLPEVAADELHCRLGGRPTVLQGELLARDSCQVWFRGVDQRIWEIPCAEVRDWRASESRLLPVEELEAVLLGRFSNCRAMQSEHFLLISDLPSSQARPYLQLLERVHLQFFALWAEHGWNLARPEAPLVAVVLRDAEAYARLSAEEFGTDAAPPPAFYGMHSNWVAVSADPAPAWREMVARNTALSQAFASQVATNLVHETTHQLMMNSGMQVRLAQHPRWVSEGLAVYFEGASPYDPNLWRKPGVTNPVRVPLLQGAIQETRATRLSDYLADDEAFLDSRQAAARYSLAWAWCHFLLRRYPHEFVSYLQQDARTASLSPPTEGSGERSEKRGLSEFLPGSTEEVEGEFRRYALRIR